MEILRLFAKWPDGREQRRGLSEALEALERWDDALRFCYSGALPLQTDGSVRAWASLIRVIQMYRLEQIADRHLRGIAKSETFRALKQLEIVRCEVYLEPLAYSRTLSLERLSMINTTVTDGEFSALFPCRALAQLRALDLSRGHMPLERVRRLISAGAGLEVLALRDNVIRDEGAHLLAGANHMRALKLLDLRKNPISTAGQIALRRAPHLSGTDILFGRNATILGKR